jgi:Domain of unknown function (DUF4190)
VTSIPPPPPPPFPASPQGWAPYQPVPRQTTSGFAVASLVLGIAIFCTGIIGGILAVIFGNIALKRIDDAQGAAKGRGLAITGIVLGWIAIALTAVVAAGWLVYGITNL